MPVSYSNLANYLEVQFQLHMDTVYIYIYILQVFYIPTHGVDNYFSSHLSPAPSAVFASVKSTPPGVKLPLTAVRMCRRPLAGTDVCAGMGLAGYPLNSVKLLYFV